MMHCVDAMQAMDKRTICIAFIYGQMKQEEVQNKILLITSLLCGVELAA
jgi:hypothetical protein